MNSVLQPEWSPVRAIVIAWPYEDSDWSANYAQAAACYWDMLAAFSTYSDVWVLLHSSIDKAEWLASLGVMTAAKSGLNPRRCAISVIDNIPYDDTWVRDYGPLSLTDGYASFRFNGWGGKYPAELDTLVGKRLEPWLGSRVVEPDLFLEGGALEINDDGVFLANLDCVVDENRNPGLSLVEMEEQIRRNLGVKHFAWLEGIQLTGDDTDGHIDTIARFVDNQHVVYSGPNSSHPDAPALDSLEAQLKVLAEIFEWRLTALPTPVVYSELDAGQLLPATYANFLICNNVVFVPIYGVEQDSEALSALAGCFATKEIVPVRCEALLEQHGSLHCATMQIA